VNRKKNIHKEITDSNVAVNLNTCSASEPKGDKYSKKKKKKKPDHLIQNSEVNDV
jgi:hypothetical protein